MKKYPLLFLPFCALVRVAFASSGDRSFAFQNCLLDCRDARCSSNPPVTLPLVLRLTGWKCEDDCKYQCMHEISDQQVKANIPIEQYYGKWPFWRFGGMQEPASVLFSFLNLWAHWQGAKRIKSRVPLGHPMRPFYLFWSYASINSWVWSSVFHSRDVNLTERLDYFSAGLAILAALYYAVIRIFHIYPPTSRPLTLYPNTAPSTARPYKFWTFLCIVVFAAHISYLSWIERFDYTYNIIFNLVIGMTHNVLWLIYALRESLLLTRRPPLVGQAVMFVTFTTAATALELFDFPPWKRVIDAHSLWHLATAPLAYYWYGFLVEDSLGPSWRGHRT